MSVEAYNQAIQTGRYAKPSGLCGKYDNVRRFWEDGVTRAFSHPFIAALARRNENIRICDLGCGSCDGLELIRNNLLPDEKITAYHGIDINQQLLEQAKSLYGSDQRVLFIRGDFLEGLPVKDEPPYDIYLANYGTLSHCKDEQLVRLLAEIYRHAKDGSLIIIDWLGAYSFEWQNLWELNPAPDKMIDYLISYLGDGQNKDVQAFPLRLMDRNTAQALVQKAAHVADVAIKIHVFFDRSLFVGRHIETGDYHPDPQPLRQTVNSLFEQGKRTDLTQLLIRYHQREGFEQLNNCFEEIVQNWNALVGSTYNFLTGKSLPTQLTKDEFLSEAIQTMKLLTERTLSLPLEDVQANIIEPQLAYQLRSLEMHYQQGIGMGHGLGTIMEVEK